MSSVTPRARHASTRRKDQEEPYKKKGNVYQGIRNISETIFEARNLEFLRNQN